MIEDDILVRYLFILAIAVTIFTCDVFLNIYRLFLIFCGYMLVAVLWSILTWAYDKSVERRLQKSTNCGLPGILSYLDDRDSLTPSSIHTDSKLLDEAIEHVLLLFVKDFVLSWYKTQFTDITFPKVAYQNLCLVIHRIYDSIKVVNWTTVLAIKVNSVFAVHVNLFMRALKKLDESKETGSYNYNKIINEFFNVEKKIEVILSHKAICTNPKIELEYVSFLTESIMFLLFPDKIFDDITTRYAIRDILVTKAILPTINYLCDSDTINKFIHTFKSENNYTYDNFINAIRMNSTHEDLVELLKNLNAEITKLSGNDMDYKGYEDMTKKQISSLTFIKRLVLGQIDNLKTGQKIDGSTFYYDSTFSKQNSNETLSKEPKEVPVLPILKIPEIPVKSMIDNSIAFPYFSDYLDEKGDIKLLFLYVNIQSILASSSKMLESDAYKKKALFFNDERLLALRNSILGLLNSFKDFFENKKPNNIPSNFYADIFAEATSTIPSVETLIKLRDLIIELFENSNYIGPFYASNRYLKLCIDLKLILKSQIEQKTEKPENPTNSETSAEAPNLISNQSLFSSQVTFSPTIIDAYVSGEMSKQFIVYVIKITLTDKGSEKSWIVHRRFRDFCDFHDILTSKFPIFFNLSFPEKKLFKNKVQEIIDKRKIGLNTFLKNITEHELFHSSKTCFDIIVAFFDKQAWLSTRSRIIDKDKPIPPAIEIRETTESGCDNLESCFKALNADINEGSFAKARDGGNYDEYIETCALTILLDLVEDLFDVRNKTPWLARQIKTIFMDIFIAAVGDKLGRKIVDQIDYVFGTEKIVEYINLLRETFWPGNVWADVAPSRSPEIKSRERIIASSILIGLIPSELRRYLGDEVSLDGINRLFNLFQIQPLNKRLFYSLIETFIGELFPDNSYKETFKTMTELYSNTT